ncbi:MAG: SH3 domain-containing protein [Oceanipulchritudo sp.]
MPKYRVLADYEVHDPHPLILHEGVAVEVVRRDPGWPGWVWIQSADQAGWIPENCLNHAEEGPALTTGPFNGTDLSARRGEVLTVLESAPGWIYARNETGRKGWFPLFNLKPFPST